MCAMPVGTVAGILVIGRLSRPDERLKMIGALAILSCAPLVASLLRPRYRGRTADESGDDLRTGARGGPQAQDGRQAQDRREAGGPPAARAMVSPDCSEGFRDHCFFLFR